MPVLILPSSLVSRSAQVICSKIAAQILSVNADAQQHPPHQTRRRNAPLATSKGARFPPRQRSPIDSHHHWPVSCLSAMSQHSPSSTSTRPPRSPPSEPRPSASIVLLSRTNRVLLLRRVSSSSAFASASVFPGGNLSGGFHEKGLVPLPESAERHKDGEGYRLAAVRETFEESGILLARRKGGEGKSGQVLLALSEEIRDEGRKLVHGNKVRFTEWLESVGGVPDTGEFACRFCICLWAVCLTRPAPGREPHPLHALDHTRIVSAALHHADVPLPTSPFSVLPSTVCSHSGG